MNRETKVSKKVDVHSLITIAQRVTTFTGAEKLSLEL